MALGAQRFGWSAAASAALVWVWGAVPLAAQMQSRIAIRTEFQRPVDTPNPVTTDDRAVAGVPATADALIEQMSLAAGVIFAGEVTAVRRPMGFAGSAQAAAEGVVEIDLHVNQSLRGPAGGSTYTLREWSGLWAGNSGRYRVGERLLLFLYAPDAHGLSAPVHGAEGAIPLRGSGNAPGPDDASTDAAEWMVDLRWLQAQVLRKHLLPASPMRSPARPRPRNGIVPERSAEDPVYDSGPAMVNAIGWPWPRFTPAVEAQPLSQILALCHQAITLDATRRRDGVR